MELSKETDFARILELEEQYIRGLCDDIIQMKPTVVITEKGISDLAQHFLAKAGISAIRRVRKTDNLRCVFHIQKNFRKIPNNSKNFEIILKNSKKNSKFLKC